MLGAVDTDALLELVWTAPLAGVGVTLIFALLIVGATRSGEAARDDRGRAAAGYAVLAVVALTAVLSAIVFAITVIASK